MPDESLERSLNPMDILHHHRIRMTPSRIGILETMEHTDRALTAEELYSRVVARIPGIGRATIYRSITVLEEHGLLKKVHQNKVCHGYFLSQKENGHFITCQSCGVVQEIPCGEPKTFFQNVQQKTGFQVLDHLMGLTGLCPQCQE